MVAINHHITISCYAFKFPQVYLSKRITFLNNALPLHRRTFSMCALDFKLKVANFKEEEYNILCGIFGTDLNSPKLSGAIVKQIQLTSGCANRRPVSLKTSRMLIDSSSDIAKHITIFVYARCSSIVQPFLDFTCSCL